VLNIPSILAIIPWNKITFVSPLPLHRRQISHNFYAKCSAKCA